MICDEFTGEVYVKLPSGSYEWFDSEADAEAELETYWESRLESARDDAAYFRE